MTRPNLVLIHTHDTGRHLGCYGSGVDTPALNQLAKEGVLFRKAYCASPSCSASRSALLTGLYPHNNGMIGLCHRGFRLQNPRQHLSHLLRDAGYHTSLIGIQHEVPDPRQLGYDDVISMPWHHTAKQGEATAQWLGKNPKQPFFFEHRFLRDASQLSSFRAAG